MLPKTESMIFKKQEFCAKILAFLVLIISVECILAADKIAAMSELHAIPLRPINSTSFAFAVRAKLSTAV